MTIQTKESGGETKRIKERNGRRAAAVIMKGQELTAGQVRFLREKYGEYAVTELEFYPDPDTRMEKSVKLLPEETEGNELWQFTRHTLRETLRLGRMFSEHDEIILVSSPPHNLATPMMFIYAHFQGLNPQRRPVVLVLDCEGCDNWSVYAPY